MKIIKSVFSVLLIIVVVLVVLIAAGVIYFNNARQYSKTPKETEQTSQTDLIVPEILSNEVISLIQSKDFESLANFVGDGGVVFKPYYTSDISQGRILTKDEMASFFNDTIVRQWGVQDGSGFPIKLSGLAYYEKYIYPVNFIKLGKVSFGKSLAVGNTPSLDKVVSEVFAGKKVSYVEYYVSGIDPKYEGMDWTSLALLFENVTGKWYLVGIFHNEWTI